MRKIGNLGKISVAECHCGRCWQRNLTQKTDCGEGEKVKKKEVWRSCLSVLKVGVKVAKSQRFADIIKFALRKVEYVQKVLNQFYYHMHTYKPTAYST